MSNLLTIDDLGLDGVNEVLAAAQRIADMPANERKSNALRGRTVVNCFFEDSTRTRVSFELAGKLLSADVINFSTGGSSVKKGESLRDTVQTLWSMKFDVLVLRHASAGVPQQVSHWVDAAVVNAGDGAHQHPTQGLLDALTLRRALGRSDLGGVRITLVGDIAHSRVSRTAIAIFTMLGAEVTVVGPPTLLPPSIETWPVKVVHHLDDALTDADVIYTIRPQRERISEALVPSMDEYITEYGITDARYDRLASDVLIMEAGPLVRGVQMAAKAAESARNLMNVQVELGVAVRMAVLERVTEGLA